MGTAPAPAASLSPRRLEAGVRLGRFELLSLIAQGGMGAVWAARPTAGERNDLVAVKTILPEEASDPAVRAMFLDEARVASLIAHPNACAVIDYGNDEGTLYIVMEWVDGDSLRSLLRGSEGGVPCDVALRILRGVCDALHAAHELTADGEPLGLVHRDVSPHNILVGTAGDVKLIDFGIAKTRARLSETTNSGVVKGKLRYLAPEQVDGSKIDRRADVWALGAVLWSLVCGQEIYGDMGEAEIFRTLVLRDGMPTPPSTLPPAVVAILGRALAYEPKNRFESAQAMREAIDAVLGPSTNDRALIGAFVAERLRSPIALKRTSIEDARASLSDRARSTRSRRRWRHMAIGSVALAAIAAIGSVAFASRTTTPNLGRADIARAIDVAPMPTPETAPPAPTPPLPRIETTAAPVKAAVGSRAASTDKKRPKTPSKAKSSTKLGAEFDTHD